MLRFTFCPAVGVFARPGASQVPSLSTVNPSRYIRVVFDGRETRGGGDRRVAGGGARAVWFFRSGHPTWDSPAVEDPAVTFTSARASGWVSVVLWSSVRSSRVSAKRAWA